MSENIVNKYYRWLYSLVNSEQHLNSVKYDKLLLYLFNTPYYAEYEDDLNRIYDGYSFRYRIFADKFNYDLEYVEEHLSCLGDCSMLEMLVSFAYRIEDDIMSDDTQGDRVGQWFWSMIVSLGLGKMDDENFNEKYCNLVIRKFINHKYNKNGKGGLFTFTENNSDMRTITLWCQAMWYLNENFDFSKWLGGSM